MDLNETRERIIYQKDGPIAKITLNWPEKANAQDQKLAEEVDAALLDADRDYDIKVLVLKANGKGFCSGHAIGDNATDYPAFVENAMVTVNPWKAQSDLFVKPTLNLWEFSKPTIAQVHGYCVGGGTHMGLTTGGAIGAGTALALDDCVPRINAIAEEITRLVEGGLHCGTQSRLRAAGQDIAAPGLHVGAAGRTGGGVDSAPGRLEGDQAGLP